MTRNKPCGGAVGPASTRSSAARTSPTQRLGRLPGPDQHQRPGDRADHIVQEAVGLDVDPDEVVHPAHGEVRDRPDAARAVGPVGLEAVEVVPAQERPGRRGSSPRRRAAGRRASCSGAGTGRRRAVVDHVAVELRPWRRASRGTTGASPARSRTRTSCGRVAFSALTKTSRRVPRRRVEVDDLPQRMDPGVGPAAGVGRSAAPASAARSPPRAPAAPSAVRAGAASREKSVPS